jgi:hypothetical protein
MILMYRLLGSMPQGRRWSCSTDSLASDMDKLARTLEAYENCWSVRLCSSGVQDAKN